MNSRRDVGKFAQTLKRLRLEINMTQQQLGLLLDTDGASVANWERAHRYPARRHWAGLKQLFPDLAPLLVPAPRAKSFQNSCQL